MELNEKTHGTQTSLPVFEAAPTGENLQAAREMGQSFLEAGEAAIRNVLSSNSDTFLSSTRQDGGE
jgi:hypothetical protein